MVQVSGLLCTSILPDTILDNLAYAQGRMGHMSLEHYAFAGVVSMAARTPVPELCIMFDGGKRFDNLAVDRWKGQGTGGECACRAWQRRRSLPRLLWHHRRGHHCRWISPNAFLKPWYI